MVRKLVRSMSRTALIWYFVDNRKSEANSQKGG